MATVGSKGKVVSGTDGSDFSYRQTVENRYQASAEAKSKITNLFVAFVALALIIGALSCLREEFGLMSIQVIGLPIRSFTGAASSDGPWIDLAFALMLVVTGFLGHRSVSSNNIQASSSMVSVYMMASAALVFLTVFAAIRSHGLTAIFLAGSDAGTSNKDAASTGKELATNGVMYTLHAASLWISWSALSAARTLAAAKQANKSKR